MRKITSLAIILISCHYGFAQKKHYISFEMGITYSTMGSQMKEYMVANQFNTPRVNYYDNGNWLIPILSIFKSEYPKQDKKLFNYRLRYSYQLTKKTAIEAGFGHMYRSIVTGISNNGNDYNFLEIDMNTATIHAAYLVKNKKENLAIGIGPALSICQVKQQKPAEKPLSENTQYLPGANITAYWHFVNKKNWFMGFRTDMSITSPIKIEPVSMSNHNGFVSSTSTGKISSVMNTLSFTTGIKF